MDPFLFAAIAGAVVAALFALLQWRRAEDLDKRVQELEAKLNELEPPMPAPRKEEAKPAPKAAEPEDEDEDEEDEEDDEEEEDDDEEEEAVAASAPKVEPKKEEPKVEAAPPPKSEPPPKAKSEPPPKAASEPPAKPVEAAEPPPKAAPKPDLAKLDESEPPLEDPNSKIRLEALKVVADAFELARYLDFDAIVEKPSTYRVTVPITAANSRAVRYLEPGMFSCLKKVKIEEKNAILHIDASKGPP